MLLSSFLFFQRATWRNRGLQFAHRIRSPRYALALIVGVVYFFFAFGGRSLFSGSRHSSGASGLIAVADSVGPLLLILLSAFWWLYGGSRQSLAFTPAEANLLVPAPLTRRQLIQFKLLNGLPATMLTALMFTLILRASPLPAAARFASMLIFFTTLNLHQIAASLVRTSLQQQGRAGVRHAWPAVAVFTAILLTLAGSIAAAWPTVTGSGNATGTIRALREIMATFPASAAVAPFSAVLAPIAAKTLAAWPVPIAIAAVILAAHYFWVIRMDAAFEEGAVEAGALQASRVEAMRKGKRISLSSRPVKLRAPWFALPSSGEPVYAIWWKNILQVTRGTSVVLLIVFLAVPAFLIFIDLRGDSTDGASTVGAIMLFTFGAMATVMGPLYTRNDLRGDLRRIELLRTLPVGGGRLVAAEVAASTVTLSFVQLIMFSVAVGLLLFAGRMPLPPIAWLAIVPALLLVVILNCTMVLIHNGFALFFPAWANLKAGQAPGVENFGQNILTMLGTLLLFVLSLIGPLVVGIVSGASFALQMGVYAAIPAVLMFIVALYVQAAGMIAWLGHVYDRIDPVEAGLCE